MNMGKSIISKHDISVWQHIQTHYLVISYKFYGVCPHPIKKSGATIVPSVYIIPIPHNLPINGRYQR